MSAAIEQPGSAGAGATREAVKPGVESIVAHMGHRAGIVSRLAANTVDSFVVLGVVAGGYLAVSAVMFLWSPSTFHFPEPPGGVLLIVGAVVLFGYLTGSWVTTGRTYGDHLLGLRVVNFRGERLRLAGAAARAGLCVVFPIGVLYVLFSPANRSVQDVLLRTSVVYDWGTVVNVSR